MPSHRDADNTDGEANREPRVTKSLDDVFGVLQNARRRYLLYYLAATGETVLPLEDIVEGVRGYEAHGDTPPPRQPVRTSLVHNHLPRLADVGVLDHDPRRGTVQYDGLGALGDWLDRTRPIELG